MSLIRMGFFSETLGMSTQANVILPLPRNASDPVQDLPVLYLLHGMGDGASAWLRMTSIERAALEWGVAVVMPDGALSCYENMVHGQRYRDFITQELPGVIRRSFPVSRSREKTFIAGCSMGGFGALKLALSNPESYAAAGCFSAAHFEYRPGTPRHSAMLQRVYDDQLSKHDAQIIDDILRVNTGDLPMQVWHSCGDADSLKENALLTRDFFAALPAGQIDYSFRILPGRHDWAQWDAAVQLFLKDLNLAKPEVHLF